MGLNGSLPVSAIILAGGRGERLGRDKALIELGGLSLVQCVIDVVGVLSQDIIIVRRRGQALELGGVRLVTDLEPYRGVLAAIAAGLSVAEEAWSLVVACDMPFLNARLLNYMILQTAGYDAVVPRLSVGVEPLHALYHRRCLSAMKQALESGQRRVVSFYHSLRIRYIAADEIDRFDPTQRSFYNINTQEELDQAQRWLSQT